MVESASHLVLVSDRQELDLIGSMFISVVSCNHWLFGLLPASLGTLGPVRKFLHRCGWCPALQGPGSVVMLLVETVFSVT